VVWHALAAHAVRDRGQVCKVAGVLRRISPARPVIPERLTVREGGLGASAVQRAVGDSLRRVVSQALQDGPALLPIAPGAKAVVDDIFRGLEAHGRALGDATCCDRGAAIRGAVDGAHRIDVFVLATIILLDGLRQVGLAPAVNLCGELGARDAPIMS